MADAPLLEVDDLHAHFRVRGARPWRPRTLRAVDGVSFGLARGETLAVVGESGCGKSTLGRMIVGLQAPTSGVIRFDGEPAAVGSGTRPRSLRRRVQIVFQDPYASLDPRMTVHDIVGEPLRINRCYDAARVRVAVEQVGLPPSALRLRPGEFSGGQRQRIAIARALVLRPDLLILDEAVSALDVSIRAQVINLLRALQARMGLSYLFISHDLAVVHHVAGRVAVMYLGRIVEIGRRELVFGHRAHPYTRSLISAVPNPDPDARGKRPRIVLKGDPPSPLSTPSGCVFRVRCFRAQPRCAEQAPELTERGVPGLRTACHFPLEDTGDDAEPSTPTVPG